MNNWRQLFRMAVVGLLCVCVVMCFALAVSYAEQGEMAGCAVCSAMVVVFLACAARMADMMVEKNESETIKERMSKFDDEKKALGKLLNEVTEELQEYIDKAEESWKTEDFYSWYIAQLERVLKGVHKIEGKLNED